MQRIIVNLTARTRRARLGGRDYIVAPLTLIVPGVLNGSRGPLLYPPDEIAKHAQAWNHVPIVVNHPVEHGNAVSARSLLAREAIGIVLKANARGKLTAEGWFDVERTRHIDSRVLRALELGRPLELSTGLFTENHPAPYGATYNGTVYTHIARNYRPDHLAILPDLKGACSLQDGCGVLVS